MPQQLPQIAILPARYPDPWKIILQQQAQNVLFRRPRDIFRASAEVWGCMLPSILAIEAAVFFVLHEWTIGGCWKLSMRTEEARDSSKRKELILLAVSTAVAILLGVAMPVILKWGGWALC